MWRSVAVERPDSPRTVMVWLASGRRTDGNFINGEWRDALAVLFPVLEDVTHWAENLTGPHPNPTRHP